MLVGSRSEERAVDFAAKIGAEGMDNATAAAACDIAVLTVPYQAQRTTLTALRETLQGKVLVDVTVPLVPPKVMRARPERLALCWSPRALAPPMRLPASLTR